MRFISAVLLIAAVSAAHAQSPELKAALDICKANRSKTAKVPPYYAEEWKDCVAIEQKYSEAFHSKAAADKRSKELELVKEQAK